MKNIGEWKDNEINGKGIIFFSCGGHLQGYFKQGQLDGKFQIQRLNNECLEGTVNKKEFYNLSAYIKPLDPQENQFFS